MDRLLTDEEQAGLNWELNAAIEGSEGRQTKQEEMDDYLLKTQDDLNAHIVAQEIIKDYETAFEPTVPMSITYEKHHAIKSKWGIEC